MSTNKTQNLNLHSWAPLDRFTREEFNQNWAGIDAAWGDLDGRLLSEIEALAKETAAREKADAALQTVLDAKATTAALNAEIADRKNAISSLTTTVNAKATTAALNTETSARQTADTALDKRVTALENTVGPKLIKTVTLDKDYTDEYMLDVSDIDFSQWNTVRVIPELKGTGTYMVNFRSDTASVSGVPYINDVSAHIHLLFLPFHDGDLMISGVIVPRNLTYSSGLPFGTFKRMLFYAPTGGSLSLKAGSVFRIAGEK